MQSIDECSTRIFAIVCLGLFAFSCLCGALLAASFSKASSVRKVEGRLGAFTVLTNNQQPRSKEYRSEPLADYPFEYVFDSSAALPIRISYMLQERGKDTRFNVGFMLDPSGEAPFFKEASLSWMPLGSGRDTLVLGIVPWTWDYATSHVDANGDGQWDRSAIFKVDWPLYGEATWLVNQDGKWIERPHRRRKDAANSKDGGQS